MESPQGPELHSGAVLGLGRNLGQVPEGSGRPPPAAPPKGSQLTLLRTTRRSGNAPRAAASEPPQPLNLRDS